MGEETNQIAGAAKELGQDILKRVQAKAQGLWEQLQGEEKEAIEKASKRLAKLLLESFKGPLSEREKSNMAHLEATLALYTSIQAIRVRRAFWEVVGEIAEVGAKFLQGIAQAQLTSIQV